MAAQAAVNSAELAWRQQWLQKSQTAFESKAAVPILTPLLRAIESADVPGSEASGAIRMVGLIGSSMEGCMIEPYASIMRSIMGVLEAYDSTHPLIQVSATWTATECRFGLRASYDRSVDGCQVLRVLVFAQLDQLPAALQLAVSASAPPSALRSILMLMQVEVGPDCAIEFAQCQPELKVMLHCPPLFE